MSEISAAAKRLIAVPHDLTSPYGRWSLYAIRGTEKPIRLCCCFGGHWNREQAVACPVALKALARLRGDP